MSLAKVTMIGFETFLNENQNMSLFDLLQIPEDIDKETLTNEILLQAAEFEVSDSNPIVLRYHIGQWSKKWYRTFKKWVDLLAIEYSPLENYDRMEDWNDDRTDNLKDKNSGVDSSVNSGKDTLTNSGTDTHGAL